MSLHVGTLWVASSDRDRVVTLIKDYWARLGAQPGAGDPLAEEPLSLEKTGRLGFAVAPPSAGPADSGGPQWIAIYDSERYHADADLADFLVQSLQAPVVHAEFTGSVDIATIEVHGQGGPTVPKSGKPRHWGAVEDFVVKNLPHPFVYFDQLSDGDPSEFADWAIFGFEGIPYRPDEEYSGPSQEQLEWQALAQQASDLAAAGDVAGLRALWESAPSHQDDLIDDLDSNVADETVRRIYLEFAEEILARGDYLLCYPLAEAALRSGDQVLFDRACALLGHVPRLEDFG